MAKSSNMTANTADRIVEEAVDLLQQLHFDEQKGSSREGDLVTVRATPERIDDQIRLLVTCYAHGHRIADWNRLRIAIAPEAEPDRLTFLPLLDERGQASLSDLAENEYRLDPYFRIPHWFRLGAPPRTQSPAQTQFIHLARTIGPQTPSPQYATRLYTTDAEASAHQPIADTVTIHLRDALTLSLTIQDSRLNIAVQPDEASQAPAFAALLLRVPAADGKHDGLITRHPLRLNAGPALVNLTQAERKQLMQAEFEILYRIPD